MRFVTHTAIIAALYIVLTLISNTLGLASGAVQLRLAEALTILPLFTPAAVPGLFIGCILANIFTGCAVWDIIFGSLATLAGALGTYYLAKKRPLLAPVFPIAANTVIVPFILQYVYQLPGGYWYFMLTVGIGEAISCGVLGMLLYGTLKKHRFSAFINR